MIPPWGQSSFVWFHEDCSSLCEIKQIFFFLYEWVELFKNVLCIALCEEIPEINVTALQYLNTTYTHIHALLGADQC